MTVAVDSKWTKVALGVLAEFRNGINYNKDNFGKGIKVINVKDFQDYSIASFEGLEEVNPSGVIKEKDLLKNGDIIFVRSNGNRELIGRSLFIQGIHEPITHSAFTIKLRFTSNRVLPRFYAYLFRTSLIRQTLSAYGNGTNISNLNQGILTHLQVPLPPLLTQKRIVGILSAYDRLIENNTRRIKILEEMARSLYDEWFVKFRFPGYKQTKMVDSELGLIPEGWEVKNLSDLYYTSSGGTPSRKVNEYYGGSINWIKTRELNNSFIFESEEKITELGLQKSSAKLFPENTVIIAMYGATIGELGILASPAATNQACCAIKQSNNLFGRSYIFLYLLQNKTKIFSLGMGAAQQNISQQVIKKFQLLKPCAQIIERFNALADPILDEIKILQRKQNNLRKTRDLLLPKLISGEIDVENLDIEAGIINESEEVSSSSKEAIAE